MHSPYFLHQGFDHFRIVELHLQLLTEGPFTLHKFMFNFVIPERQYFKGILNINFVRHVSTLIIISLFVQFHEQLVFSLCLMQFHLFNDPYIF